MTGRSRPARLLVVHSALRWRANEGGEIADLIYGLRRRVNTTGDELLATDARAVYRVDLAAGDVTFVEVAGAGALLRLDVDAVHVHMVAQLRHLLVAALFRIRRTVVLCSPMAMLGDDFGSRSWFRGSGRFRRRVRWFVLRLRRGAWRAVATAFVCTSEHEARQAHLPPHRVVLLPMPAPRSPLGRVAQEEALDGRSSTPDGPAAYVGRFDIPRKGIDRLATWLEVGAGDRSTPALRLFAPDDRGAPATIARLVTDGVIDWDRTSTGAALAPELRRCRAVLLLTRYEAQPRVLREAVLLGVPVITTASSNFAEVLAVLDAGVIVDGDDPVDVQAAYERASALTVDRRAAAALFDRERLGAFLYAWLVDAADGRRAATDYYAHARSVQVR